MFRIVGLRRAVFWHASAHEWAAGVRPCLAKNTKAVRPREQAAQDPDPVESGGETGHPFVDWVPGRGGRICVCYASQDRKEILAKAKAAASSTMGYDGKISDHATSPSAGCCTRPTTPIPPATSSRIRSSWSR